MTDREMLEFAAKAAGLKEYGWMADTLTHVVNNQFVFWEPLTDDGEALRLAVKLHMDFTLSGKHAAVAQAGTHMKQEFCNGDAYAATRRAITRAAAEIGKAMP